MSGATLRPAAGTVQPPPRDGLVLGLGSCVDYEAEWDGAVLQRLIDTYAVTPEELDRDRPVRTERDLVASIASFVRDGVGGERFVASPDLLVAFARRGRFRPTVGGTNLRAANVLHLFGIGATLHVVSTSSTMRDLLPPQVDVLCSATQDSVEPHLIVQYPAGATLRVGAVEVRAARPNRLIYVNDRSNRELLLHPDLGCLLSAARLFLVSGLNTVADLDVLQERLSELRGHLERLPSDALVLFEDAGYHVPAMSAVVRDALLDRIDVHGMNEDELQGHAGRAVDVLDADDLSDALATVSRLIPVPALVVHSAAWALALGPEASRWRPALEMATTVAAARYAHGDAMTAEDVETAGRAPRHRGAERLATDLARRLGDRVCCVPAVDIDVPRPTTVGLGDAFVGGFIAGITRAATPG